jgi:Zn-dependent peptidase ImmA (M78 family)
LSDNLGQCLTVFESVLRRIDSKHVDGRIAFEARFVERCIEFTADLRWAYENESPPFSLNRLVRHFGVAAVRLRLLDRDARLVRSNQRILIELNSLSPVARRRLSMAHEIAHIIVNEVAGRDRYAVSHSDPSEEALCNLLGAQLLSPDWAILDYLKQNGSPVEWQPTVHCRTILSAADYFGVSVTVMARRMLLDLDLAPAKVATIWRYRDGALRVSSAWNAPHEQRLIPLDKTAPLTSVLLKAYESEGAHCATEQLTFGPLEGSFVVEAEGFRSSPTAGITTRAVLALLTPS